MHHGRVLHRSELEGAGHIVTVAKRESQMLTRFAFSTLFNLGSLAQAMVPLTIKMDLPT